MSYAISVDAQGAITALSDIARGMHGALTEGLRVSSELVKTEMKKRAPDAFGNLRDSIDYHISPAALSSEIKPAAPYADAVETGSRPHWTSASAGSPLEQWALFRGLNPYAVQRSIASKGTKAHPYIVPTYDAMAPLVIDQFSAGVAAFLQGVDRASGL